MTLSADPGDAALAQRALGGDQRAYAQLVGRHKEAVYKLIRRYGADADEAYDLSQQTFISAWSSLRRYDTSRPFATWIRTIALNKCRDWSRRAAVRRFLLSPLSLDSATVDAVPSTALDAEADTLAQERQGALASAVASLPKALKEPLLLTALEGLSQREAGEVLGISTKAVETRVARARKVLADRFREPTDDGP